MKKKLNIYVQVIIEESAEKYEEFDMKQFKTIEAAHKYLKKFTPKLQT